jgi:hypothetical protein
VTGRTLPPHEHARRDQLAAEIKDRLRSGEFVIVLTNEQQPGTQCSYCDCPVGPDSPHNRRGYVCPYFCHADPVLVATLMYLNRRNRHLPLCARHCDACLADLAVLSALQPVVIDARTEPG